MAYHVVTPFYRYQNEAFLTEHLKNVIWHKIEGTVDWKDQCYGKIQKFIKENDIVDDDYYMVLMDDDAYEPDFLTKLKKYNDDLIVVSMKRGDRTPKEGIPHPAYTLVADPSNMRVGQVGMEQMIFKGFLFKKIVFGNEEVEDGLLAERIKHLPIKYAPEIFVYFNYLQPKRWDKVELKSI